MTHKQALIQILHILQPFPPDWHDQVLKVVRQIDSGQTIMITAVLSTSSAEINHREAIVRILRILQAFPENWSNKVWRVVQHLRDPEVTFCLVEFDPLPKIFEDIWNPEFWNRNKPTQERTQ
jgi:hypothetical protein